MRAEFEERRVAKQVRLAQVPQAGVLAAERSNLRKYFVAVAREHLSPETFDAIMSLAQARRAAQIDESI